jgi:hypothetical protein
MSVSALLCGPIKAKSTSLLVMEAADGPHYCRSLTRAFFEVYDQSLLYRRPSGPAGRAGLHGHVWRDLINPSFFPSQELAEVILQTFVSGPFIHEAQARSAISEPAKTEL